MSFHGLRHSYASISLRAGTPLKVVSEMLRHTTTAITADLYTHVLGNLLGGHPKCTTCGRLKMYQGSVAT